MALCTHGMVCVWRLEGLAGHLVACYFTPYHGGEHDLCSQDGHIFHMYICMTTHGAPLAPPYVKLQYVTSIVRDPHQAPLIRGLTMKEMWKWVSVH